MPDAETPVSSVSHAVGGVGKAALQQDAAYCAREGLCTFYLNLKTFLQQTDSSEVNQIKVSPMCYTILKAAQHTAQAGVGKV